LDLSAGYLWFKLLDNAIGKMDTPGLNAYEHSIFKVQVILQYLVGQTLYGDGQLLLSQDRLQEKYFYKITKKKAD